MNMSNPCCFRVIILFSFFLSGKIFAQKVQFIAVPDQDLYLNSFVGRNSNKIEHITAFRISEQITYGQYKKYLSDIKKDSSDVFYQSQLPKIERQESLNKKYQTSSEYDDEPVIGVSQENASNYAHWYQIKQGFKNKIYRLPAIHEWISFYHANKTDFEKTLFFDWTINAFDHSIFEFAGKDDFPFYYFQKYKMDSPPTFKLKCVIGNSYKIRAENPTTISKTYGYFANEGYPDVSFRIIEINDFDPFAKYVYPFQDDIKLK